MKQIELLGISDIAQKTGLTRQTIANWLKSPGSPVPVAKPLAGPVYNWAEVEPWVQDKQSKRRVHDGIKASVSAYVGKVLSTAEIIELTCGTVPGGSVLPNDHADRDHKGHCWCAGTEERLFKRVERGRYEVLSQRGDASSVHQDLTPPTRPTILNVDGAPATDERPNQRGAVTDECRQSSSVSAAIERLRASKAEAERKEIAEGRLAGRSWAEERASYRELYRVSQIDLEKDHIDLDALKSVIDSKDHFAKPEFLKQVFGTEESEPCLTGWYVAGFIEGAKEFFAAVRDKL